MGNPDELTENEKELLEAMKAPPEPGEEVTVEDEETESDALSEPEAEPERDEKGRFKAKQGDEAEEPAEDAEPEATADGEETAEESEPDEAQDRLVPISALQHERHRRQEARSEAEELRQKIAELEQRLAPQPDPQAMQQQMQQQPDQDDMPDPVLEPDQFKSWLLRQREEAVKPFTEMQRRQQEEQQRVQQFNALRQFAANDEAQFREEYKDRDYDAALDFMREKVAQNAKMMGYAEDQIPNIIAQQEAQIAATAYQRGIRPSAYVWNFAVQNGFQEAKPEPAKDIQRLAESERQTRSAAGASGAPRNEDGLTADQIARMSDAEFQKLYAKDPDAVRRALGG